MAAVAGLRGSGDWATDERPKNFREYILWRNPNGSSPIFALMAKIKKEVVDDAEFSWWDEPNDIVRLQVNGALTSSDTTITVDSTDPSSSAPGNAWGLATHLKPGDILMVEPTTDSATFNHEQIEVTGVNSATEFTVRRGAAGTSAASISNDAYLLKVSSSYAEGTGAPDAASRNPIKYYNYAQIFKDTYEITGTAKETKTRTGDPVSNDKKRKAFDHARDIEMALLFGQRNETTGSNGKPKRTMGGIRSFIGSATTTILGASWTLSNFLDAVAPVFDFDTEAGDQRMMFMGNTGLNYLHKKIVAENNASQINFVGTSKQYGMAFNEYRIPQGSLFLRTHPLMNRNSLYRNAAFIIDFSALRYRPVKNRDTRFKDNVQAEDEDLVRGFWQTEAGIEVRYGGLTCGYIGGLNN